MPLCACVCACMCERWTEGQANREWMKHPGRCFQGFWLYKVQGFEIFALAFFCLFSGIFSRFFRKINLVSTGWLQSAMQDETVEAMIDGVHASSVIRKLISAKPLLFKTSTAMAYGSGISPVSHKEDVLKGWGRSLGAHQGLAEPRTTSLGGTGLSEN